MMNVKETDADKVFQAAAEASGDFLGQLLELKRLGVPNEELLKEWEKYCRLIENMAGLSGHSEESEQPSG